MEGFKVVDGFNDSVPTLLQRVKDAGAEDNESYMLVSETGTKYVLSKKHCEEARAMKLVTFLVKESDGSDWIQGNFKEVGNRGYIRVLGVPDRAKFSVRG